MIPYLVYILLQPVLPFSKHPDKHVEFFVIRIVNTAPPTRRHRGGIFPQEITHDHQSSAVSIQTGCTSCMTPAERHSYQSLRKVIMVNDHWVAPGRHVATIAIDVKCPHYIRLPNIDSMALAVRSWGGSICWPMFKADRYPRFLGDNGHLCASR
jgi:hypothetical protein